MRSSPDSSSGSSSGTEGSPLPRVRWNSPRRAPGSPPSSPTPFRGSRSPRPSPTGGSMGRPTPVSSFGAGATSTGSPPPSTRPPRRSRASTGTWGRRRARTPRRTSFPFPPNSWSGSTGPIIGTPNSPAEASTITTTSGIASAWARPPSFASWRGVRWRRRAPPHGKPGRPASRSSSSGCTATRSSRLAERRTGRSTSTTSRSRSSGATSSAAPVDSSSTIPSPSSSSRSGPTRTSSSTWDAGSAGTR